MEIKPLILVCLVCFTITSAASSKKKSTEEAATTDAPSPGPAILAIEIVDGSDNSTDVRNNTKRTIESALGYGYQGNYYPTSTGKKYMVYPYSQHDIPPAKHSSGSSESYQTNVNIQKDVSYKTEKELLTPVATQAPAYNQGQQYYPSTLFSTVGQGGVIGGLSSNFPSQQTQAATIPVIILRVYTNQLESPGIYPNLPQSHPYANNLNSVNLQSILSNYIQQYMQQAIQSINKPVFSPNYPNQSGYPNTNLVYQGYQDKNNYAYYRQPESVYQQQQQQQQQHQQQHQVEYKEPTLPTSENYPSDSHTRVIYRGPNGHVPNIPNYRYTSQEYGTPKDSYSTNQMSQITQNYPTNQLSQISQLNQISQEYLPQTKQNYQLKNTQKITQNYETPKQSYSTPDDYQNTKQTYNSNEVYTDSNGQSFIYVYPNQNQGQAQQYYQPEYQQDYQQEYQQNYGAPTYNSQEYSSQEYQQEDRKYLPTPSTELPTKLYNYHADSGSAKDRSKKSSGRPLTFETKDKNSGSKN